MQALEVNDRAPTIGTPQGSDECPCRSGPPRRPVDLGRPVLLLALLGLVACGEGAPLTAPSDTEDASSPPDARLVMLGGLGGSSTVPVDVNESLQVAGTAETAEGRDHAFLWDGGEMRDLGTLGGSWSTAADLNNWGQVTGTSVTAAGEARAFFWSHGEMHQIGTLGGRESHGVAVNDRGEVAGYSTTKDGEVHAFLWSRGRMHDLGTLGGSGSFTAALNEQGGVVGRSTTEAGAAQAFRWSDGEIANLTSDRAGSSSAVDVSRRGHVIVNATVDGRRRAYRWSDGMLSVLATPEEASSVATDVNGAGNVVGQISSSAGPTRAVLWGDRGPQILHPAELPDGRSTATGVNDAGAVTGGLRPGEGPATRAFFWSDGVMRTLPPDRLEPRLESTAGIGLNENGAVLGLASYPSGQLAAFLWVPPARRVAEPGEAGDRPSEGVFRTASPEGPLDDPISGLRDVSPEDSASLLGGAVHMLISAERDRTLSWPKAIRALHRDGKIGADPGRVR